MQIETNFIYSFIVGLLIGIFRKQITKQLKIFINNYKLNSQKIKDREEIKKE